MSLVIHYHRRSLNADYDDASSGQLGAGCSTFAGRRYSQAEIQAFARQAGWPENLLRTVSAVAYGESDGYAGAVGRCGGGEYSVGLMQINIKPSLGRSWTEAQLRDPVFNLQCALQLYRQGGWSHWGAYTNGSYRRHLDGAGTSVAGSIPPAIIPSVDTTTAAIGTGGVLALGLLAVLVLT